jgi:protoporphyrinogen oxidase
MRVTCVTGSAGRLQEVELANGTRLNADVVICALPTETYFALAPSDRTATLNRIRFTALLSAVCGAVAPKIPDFYWLRLTSLGHTAGGIFLLNSLNSTISAPGESCVNFVTHLQSRNDPRFVATDELMRRYREDFSRIFRSDLQLRWFQVSRLPMYSPIFVTDYKNPPVRSETWANVFFAGNYRTFPSIASTGTALLSGVQAAQAVLHEHGNACDLSESIRAFRH